MGYLDDLAKLNELLDAGLIAPDDFERQKNNILAAAGGQQQYRQQPEQQQYQQQQYQYQQPGQQQYQQYQQPGQQQPEQQQQQYQYQQPGQQQYQQYQQPGQQQYQQYGQQQYYASRPPYGASPYGASQPQYGSANQSLRVAAAIFNLIATIIIACFTFGIGLAWGIPMTVCTFKSINSPYKHTALGVCSLLFLGIIPGILLLCSGGIDRETY